MDQHLFIVFHSEHCIFKFNIVVGTLAEYFLVDFDWAVLFEVLLADIVEQWVLQCLLCGQAEVRIEFQEAFEEVDCVRCRRREHLLQLVLVPVLAHKVQVVVRLITRDERAV